MARFVSAFIFLFAGTLLLEATAQGISCSGLSCSSSMTPPTQSFAPSLTPIPTTSADIPSSEDTASNGVTASTTFVSFTSTLQLSATPSSSSPANDDEATTSNDRNTDFINDLWTIVIISCVMAFLLLVICILMTAVVVLCQRSIGIKIKQRRRSVAKQKKLPSPTSVQVMETRMSAQQKPSPAKADSKNKARLSPEKKTEFGSISDVPLLCRVLQDYDASQHNARITQYARSSVASSSSFVDSPVHNARTPSTALNGVPPTNYNSVKSTPFPRSASNDFEASIKTQTSTLSQGESGDYDELEKIIVSLEEQVEGIPSPSTTSGSPPQPVKTLPKSPQISPPRSPTKSPFLPPAPVPSPKSPLVKSHTRHAPVVAVVVSPKPIRSPPVKNQESVDEFGYQVVDTEKIFQSLAQKDAMMQAESTDDIFDDPKYTIPVIPSQTSSELYSIPEDARSSSPAAASHSNPGWSNGMPEVVDDRTSTPVFSPEQMAKESGEKPFTKKEFKEYMSLHQVLEMVEKKMSPSREPLSESDSGSSSEDGDEDNDGGDLYCPRVVMPSTAVANASN